MDEIRHENEADGEGDDFGDSEADDTGDSEADDTGDGEGDDSGDSEGDSGDDEVQLSAEENESDEAFLGSEYDEDDYSVDGEEISHADDEDLDGNSDDVDESIFSVLSEDESIVIDSVDDIVKMDMHNLQNEDVSKLLFGSLEVAYNFYCWFAKMNGFAVRKGQVIKNKNGDVLQQTFVCNLEGFRRDGGLTVEGRKHGPKHETKCGCEAKFRVHIDIITQRWYITIFTFDHNHVC
jgi:hypothetical protein